MAMNRASMGKQISKSPRKRSSKLRLKKSSLKGLKGSRAMMKPKIKKLKIKRFKGTRK
tara:strand:- start:87 stop:260 length:174 start_codon:yes stop_codon:yes gene_type:complete